MTTARVAPSSVESMPAKASAESAALPIGPATYMSRPSGALSSEISCMSSAMSGACSHPLTPRSNVTIVCSASPSSEGNGPCALPTTPSKPANSLASLAAAAMSSSVMPPERS